MPGFQEEYEQKVRHWWNELPQPTQDQLHKAAVDNHMDDNLAGLIINSANFVSGPPYTEWENGDGSWHWSESMRQVILSECNKSN